MLKVSIIPTALEETRVRVTWTSDAQLQLTARRGRRDALDPGFRDADVVG
jgi:hypothetical protein